MRQSILHIPAFLSVMILCGCQPPGADVGANVYTANQVNTRQQAKVINILAVMPAKIEVSNAQAQKSAQLFGGVLYSGGGFGRYYGPYYNSNRTTSAAGSDPGPGRGNVALTTETSMRGGFGTFGRSLRVSS